MIDVGTFGRLPSVEECLHHPTQSAEMCESMGVVAPAVVIAGGKEFYSPSVPPQKVGGITFEFYRHPTLLIPQSIAEFTESIRANELFNVGYCGSVEDCNPRYREAMEIYSNYKKALRQ